MWREAFERFVRAINAPAERALLDAAVTADVVVERHAPGREAADPILETFEGVDALARWLARTAARSVFSLAGEPRADGECATVEYAIDLDDFHNGGVWIARARPDGRIAHLAHRPFPL